MAEPLRWNTNLPGGEPLRWNMGPQFTWGGSVPVVSPTPNTMSIPNVAVAFPQATQDDIADAITALKALFPVLSPVGPTERDGLQNIAAGREPYVAEAFTDAEANPGTVPGTVPIATWALVEEQFAGLDKAESLLLELIELIQGVKAVAGDVRYKYTRKYYDYLGGNLDDLPGAQSIHEKISQLFAKQGGKGTPPPPTP